MMGLRQTWRHVTTPSLVRRSIRFFIQRRTRGWDDSDTWNIDVTLSRWIVPRLQRFRELTNGYPHYGPDGDEGMTMERWHAMIDDMIYAFAKLDNDYDPTVLPSEDERARRGLDYFAKYVGHLWW